VIREKSAIINLLLVSRRTFLLHSLFVLCSFSWVHQAFIQENSCLMVNLFVFQIYIAIFSRQAPLIYHSMQYWHSLKQLSKAFKMELPRLSLDIMKICVDWIGFTFSAKVKTTNLISNARQTDTYFVLSGCNPRVINLNLKIKVSYRS